MTLLVRDEESLLDLNIRYHLSRGVDLIIATDNLSVDSTKKILKKYEKTGVLVYIYEPEDDYSQDLWVTRMAKLAAERYGADWVFHVDADEFWWPEEGETLKSSLAGVSPDSDGLVVDRHNFPPVPDLVDEQNFYRKMIVREASSLNALGGPLPPKVMHRAAQDIQIQQGNHAYTFPSRPAKPEKSDAFKIWHFPLRTFASFQNRIAQGGKAYSRNKRLPRQVGQTWRELAELDEDKLKSHFDERCLSSESLRYEIQNGSLIEDVRFRDYVAVLENRTKS